MWMRGGTRILTVKHSLSVITVSLYYYPFKINYIDKTDFGMLSCNDIFSIVYI